MWWWTLLRRTCVFCNLSVIWYSGWPRILFRKWRSCDHTLYVRLLSDNNYLTLAGKKPIGCSLQFITKSLSVANFRVNKSKCKIFWREASLHSLCFAQPFLAKFKRTTYFSRKGWIYFSASIEISISRQILLIMKLWTTLHNNCSPLYTIKDIKCDPLSESYAILSKAAAAQNLGENIPM